MPHRFILLFTFAVVTAIVLAGAGSGGMKRQSVPAERVVAIIVASTIAAAACRRLWRPWMSPLVGGLAGAIVASPMASPYGGLLGILIGAMILVMPKAAKPTGDDTIDSSSAKHDG